MARIRTIKPEFWESEQLGDVSVQARLLFIGIWTFADDRGVIQNRPKQIRGQLFRYDEIDVATVEGWIGELVGAGLLKTFEHDGKSYLFVPTWSTHQKIDRKQTNYVNPPPPVNPAQARDNSTNTRRGIDEGSTSARRRLAPESKGVESKGVESRGRESKPSSDIEILKESSHPVSFSSQPLPPKRVNGHKIEGGNFEKKSRGSRLPDDFALTDDWRKLAEEARQKHNLGPLDLDLEADAFAAHWHGKAGAAGVKGDWRSAWVLWVLRAPGTADKPMRGRSSLSAIRKAIEKGAKNESH